MYRPSSRAKAIRRVIAYLLCVSFAVGLLLFSPGEASVRVTAAGVALSTDGLAEQDRLGKQWLRLLQELPVEEVVTGWAAGTPAQKAQFTKAAPVVAGNLDGIPYTVRDRLNRTALAQRTTRMEKHLSQHPDDSDARTAVQAYKAIAAALKPRYPRRYLMSLSADVPPLAAISVGNPDAADLVTWQVPGMGTYSTDMQLWALAAKNVYTVQGTVGASKKRAVIAWMGYTPPPPPPSIEASKGEYAVAGAPNLVRDIQAFRAVRAADAVTPTINVVAHSYGTTMAADALASADLGVNSFVMLGSAGVERTIPDAAALHAEHVYVSQASKDSLAAWGRISRLDPRSPGFGATHFGSDGNAQQKLAAVTGHAPILHSAYNDKITSNLWTNIVNAAERLLKFREHERNFGYLDRKTESLANVATVTAAPTSKRRLTGG